MMIMIGTEVAKMHIVDTVYRDLTTLNVMLRHPPSIRDSPEGMQQLVHRHVSAPTWVEMR